MIVEPRHRVAAGCLVGYSPPPPKSIERIPARVAFLAAIERISDGFHQATSECRNASVAVCVSDSAEPRVALLVEPLADSDGWEADLTADEAEARGWELIALAHLARTGGRRAPHEADHRHHEGPEMKIVAKPAQFRAGDIVQTLEEGVRYEVGKVVSTSPGASLTYRSRPAWTEDIVFPADRDHVVEREEPMIEAEHPAVSKLRRIEDALERWRDGTGDGAAEGDARLINAVADVVDGR